MFSFTHAFKMSGLFFFLVRKFCLYFDTPGNEALLLEQYFRLSLSINISCTGNCVVISVITSLLFVNISFSSCKEVYLHTLQFQEGWRKKLGLLSFSSDDQTLKSEDVPLLLIALINSQNTYGKITSQTSVVA